jgi:hypothetical protein
MNACAEAKVEQPAQEAFSGTPTPGATVQTRAGELRIVPEPWGTRGYDDLGIRANRENLGRGARPAIASVVDCVRMLDASEREADAERLLWMRRMMELERQLVPRRGSPSSAEPPPRARRVQQLLHPDSRRDTDASSMQISLSIGVRCKDGEAAAAAAKRETAASRGAEARRARGARRPDRRSSRAAGVHAQAGGGGAGRESRDPRSPCRTRDHDRGDGVGGAVDPGRRARALPRRAEAGAAGRASSLASWSQARPSAQGDQSYPQRACEGRESWRDRSRAEFRRGPDVAGWSPVVALDGTCRPRTFEVADA